MTGSLKHHLPILSIFSSPRLKLQHFGLIRISKNGNKIQVWASTTTAPL